MYILDGLNMVKNMEKQLMFLQIQEWDYKEIGLMEILAKENGYSQMENFIKAHLKIINQIAKVFNIKIRWMVF